MFVMYFIKVLLYTKISGFVKFFLICIATDGFFNVFVHNAHTRFMCQNLIGTVIGTMKENNWHHRLFLENP